MATPRHDGGPDTGPQVVAALLHVQAPQLAGLPLHLLSNTGSDNTLYRLGSGFVVRLPRFADAAARLDVELDWLPRLTGLPVAVPEVVRGGEPGGSYPYRWAVMRWLVGVDAWYGRHHEDWFGLELGHDLAAVVAHLRATPVAHAPRREPGQRGGPLHALDAGCAGGSSAPRACSTCARRSGCGTNASREPRTVWRLRWCMETSSRATCWSPMPA